MSKSNEHTHMAIKAAAIYAVFGGLWILLSDRILGLVVTDMETYATIQTYKGWAYVVITALLVFKVFHGYLKQLIEVRDMLKIQEERYDLAMRGSNIGTWDWDITTNDVVFNEQFTRMLGYEVDSFPPIYDSWEATLHPEDKRQALEKLNAHLKGETDEYSAEFRMLTADRKWKWIQATGKIRRRDKDGQPLRMIGTHIDLTRQKDTQTELEMAKETAEAAKATKDHFFANMGHEIRTPLNALLGMLRLLRDSNMTREQEEMLANAEASGSSLLAVINELMTQHDTNIETAYACKDDLLLSELLDSVTRIFRAQLEHLGIRLRFDIDPTLPPYMCGDQDRLRQALCSLVSNAFHFTPKTEIAITVEGLRDGEGTPHRFLLVQVNDDGRGMTAREIEGVFNTLPHLQNSDSVGVGLRVSSRLVRAMGGSLCFDSDNEEGTLVAFTIPVHHDQSLHLVETQPRNRHETTASLRILLVEDDPINRIVGRRFLEKLGHSVAEAGNGSEAIDMLRHNDFDCVLMDIRMPILNGRDAASAIRTDESLGDKTSIPIIAVTAQTIDATTKLESSGFNGYIGKPISLDALSSELKRVVGQK